MSHTEGGKKKRESTSGWQETGRVKDKRTAGQLRIRKNAGKRAVSGALAPSSLNI